MPVEDYRGCFRFSPPEDQRLNVVAKITVPSSQAAKRNDLDARLSAQGRMTLRYQPDANFPWTFWDVKARIGSSYSSAALRACHFVPSRNAAVFAFVPLMRSENPTPNKTIANSVAENAVRMGIRYSTPRFSSGIVMKRPLSSNAVLVDCLWVCGRSGGGFLYGIQSQPNAFMGNLSSLNNLESPSNQNVNFAHVLGDVLQSASFSFGYQPPHQSAHGRGMFSTSIEIRPKNEVALSFLHHMAVQRNIRNPFESSDVVGITNYIDIGFQMTAKLGQVDQHKDNHFKSESENVSSMRLAASWQANKNVAIKGRVGLEDVAVGAIIKSWWQPAFTVALTLSKSFDRAQPPRFGMAVNVENYRNLRYERSYEGQKMSGARVTQRHVAGKEDLAYHEGRGLLVPLESVDNPKVLGQEQAYGAQFL